MFYHALTGNGGTTGDLKPVLLWENSNPTAEFAPQTISLDLTDYAGVIVEFKKTTNSTKINTRLYAKKNEDVDEIFGAGSYYTKGDSNTARGVNVTDAGVTFAQGYGNMTLNNKTTIPIKIYGVKNYIVEPAVGDLLWHNDNPTEALAAKEIAGDYSKYSKICVEYRLSTTVDYKLTLITEKHNTYQSGIMVTEASGSVYRRIAFKDSTINLLNATKIDSSMATTTVNTSCIITDIYGIE